MQLDAIHKAFRANFLLADTLWLFGSRVDDQQIGYIEHANELLIFWDALKNRMNSLPKQDFSN